MRTGNAGVDLIAAEQDWAATTLLALAMQFMEREGYDADFCTYLEKVQEEENGTEDNDDGMPSDNLFCKECGESCFLTWGGIAYHGEPGMIDYHRDGEHIALPELEEE